MRSTWVSFYKSYNAGLFSVLTPPSRLLGQASIEAQPHEIGVVGLNLDFSYLFALLCYGFTRSTNCSCFRTSLFRTSSLALPRSPSACLCDAKDCTLYPRSTFQRHIKHICLYVPSLLLSLRPFCSVRSRRVRETCSFPDPIPHFPIYEDA